jgi:hypothetical protein
MHKISHLVMCFRDTVNSSDASSNSDDSNSTTAHNSSNTSNNSRNSQPEHWLSQVDSSRLAETIETSQKSTAEGRPATAGRPASVEMPAKYKDQQGR